MKLLQRHQKQLKMLPNGHLVSISVVTGGKEPTGPPRPGNPGSGAAGQPDLPSQHAGLNLKREPGPSASLGKVHVWILTCSQLLLTPPKKRKKNQRQCLPPPPPSFAALFLCMFTLLFAVTTDAQMCVITCMWACM